MSYRLRLISGLTISSSLVLGSCGGGSTPQGPPPNPAPAIQSVTPNSAAAGTNGFTLTINGSNFLASSVVSWNGAAKQLTFVNSSQLTATISVTDLATQGTVQVAVTNPAPGGGQSSATFTVSAPAAPVVMSVSPSTAVVGGAAFMLAVSGSNFIQNSVVQWSGSNRPTTYVSNTELTASIPASDISTTTGNQPISVSTPGSGGGNSNTVPVLVEYPLPAINALSPGQVILGSGAFTLSVSGSNFVNGATVYWNSVARVTQFVSSTQLTASILSSDTGVVTGGNVSVTVQNPSPSAGISNVQDFTLENPAPVLSSITPTSAPAGALVAITVSGSGFVLGASLQVGSQSFSTTYRSATSVSTYLNSVPVGSLPLTVLNPAPNVGASNALLFDSTALGPGGQFVVATVDPTGALSLESGGSMSATGRYFAFGGYIRDTCLTISSGCVPSTIMYAQITIPPSSGISYSATGVSANGRYISSQLISGGNGKGGDLEFSDSCLGAPTGCVPTTNTLLPSAYPGTAMSSDGRYILYGVGNSVTSPVPLLVFDTCTGAPPGCPQTSIPITSSVVPNGIGNNWSMSADGRFIAYPYGQMSSNLTQIRLYDSCLGAAPGCAPTDVAMSDSALRCWGPSLSSDALYLTYTCDGVGGGIYLQNTCANTTSGCTSTPHNLALPEAVGVWSTAVSSGGRFVFFQSEAVDGPFQQKMIVYVYDTCNGSAAGCATKTAPVSLAKDGSLANADCYLVGISEDGQYIAIWTESTNLATVPAGVPGATYIWKNPLF